MLAETDTKSTKSAKTNGSAKHNKLTWEVVTVTPSVAAAWMEKNEKNRKISPKTKSAYQRDMMSGHWKLTGDAIRFDINGRLIDGQHRLAACVAANVNFTTLVVYGLQPEDQTVIDSTRPRTASDALAIDGYHATHIIAAAAKLIVATKAGISNESIKASNSEILAVVRDRPMLPRSCAMANRAPNGVPRSMLGFVHYVGAVPLKKQELADAFVDVFATGVPAYAGCAAHRLRERMIRKGDTRNALSKVENLRSLIHAWNMFVARTPIEHFKAPKSVSFDDLKLDKL